MASTSSAPHAPTKWVLAHDHGFHAVLRAQEFWRYRRLVGFFGRQAFSVLYRRTRLGILWVPIRTLMPLLIGTLVYGGLMDIPSNGVPYFLFITGASIAWNCFAGPWVWGSRGLEMNRDLVSRLYFPRIILPLGTMTPGLVEPVMGAIVFGGALVYYGASKGIWYLHVSPALLLLPVIAAIIVLLAFSLALLTSPYQVRARDVRFILGYLLTFWMYLTPVIYPISIVPVQYRWLMWALNPMAPLVEAFQAILFGWPGPPAWAFALSCAEALVLFAAGFWHFHVMEASTVDTL